MHGNERDVELPWLLVQPITFPALDVGSSESLYLEALDGPVDGIDVRDQQRPGLRTFYTGDIRTWTAPQKYPTVIALSTIEHIGLECPDYGTTDDDILNGDRKALLGCIRNTAPGGTVLVTVPFGERGNFGWYRRYDPYDLEFLLRGHEWRAEYHYNSDWKVGGVALVTIRVP